MNRLKEFFETIRDGINNANPADSFDVPAGTYHEHVPSTRRDLAWRAPPAWNRIADLNTDEITAIWAFSISFFVQGSSKRFFGAKGKMRSPGFGPGSSAWEADVLARLDYDRISVETRKIK